MDRAAMRPKFAGACHFITCDLRACTYCNSGSANIQSHSTQNCLMGRWGGRPERQIYVRPKKAGMSTPNIPSASKTRRRFQPSKMPKYEESETLLLPTYEV